MIEFVRENGEKIPADDKTRVEAALDDLKKVKDGDDIEAIKKATDALGQVSQAATQKLYEATAAQQGAGAPEGGAAGSSSVPDDDDIVDAEIVDEK